MDDAQGRAVPRLPGRVRLVRVIGAGAFATVWLGHDPELNSDVAVKILADNWAQRADVRERFLSEARLLRRVESGRVARIYDLGALDESLGSRPFFVMTYAEGGTLADLLQAGPLPLLRAQEVLRQVAEGLDALHRKGIVHRDLNPHNILLREDSPDSDLLIADLGLAKDIAAASGLTQPAGTGDYRAPEQLGYSDEIGPGADVFAYAVLARQLLPPSVLADPVASEALSRASAPDPGDRPTLRELAAVVTTAGQGEAARTDPVPPPAARTVLGPGRRSAAGAAPESSAAGASSEPSAAAAPGARGSGRGRRRWGLVAACLVSLVALAVVGGFAWSAYDARREGSPAASSSLPDPLAVSPTGSGQPAATSSPSVLPVCTAAKMSLTAASAGPRSGTVQLQVVATNTSSAPCTVTGWPGVSLVGNDSGDQIGQPAVRFGPSGSKVVVSAGGTTTVTVQVAAATAQPGCGPVPARGLRVYLPDTTSASFVPVTGLSGCSNPTTPSLLTVSAFS